jgi:hypothetical protein
MLIPLKIIYFTRNWRYFLYIPSSTLKVLLRMKLHREGQERSSKCNSQLGLVLCYAPHKQEQQLIASGRQAAQWKGLMSACIGFSGILILLRHCAFGSQKRCVREASCLSGIVQFPFSGRKIMGR